MSPDAVARGAAAVVAGPGGRRRGAPCPFSPWTIRAASSALAAARFYGRQPETMVAVTGTAGKTSVASFTRQIWAHAGHAGRDDRHDRRHGAGPRTTTVR